MAGLVPAIHAFDVDARKDVDARDKRGHDGWEAKQGKTWSAFGQRALTRQNFIINSTELPVRVSTGILRGGYCDGSVA
jgi:hypothetical protein